MVADPYVGKVTAYGVPIDPRNGGPMYGADGKPVKTEPRDLRFSASDVVGELVVWSSFGATATTVSFPDYTYVEDLQTLEDGADTTRLQWRKGNTDIPKEILLAQAVNTTTTKDSRFGDPFFFKPATLIGLKQL